jgi:hypothetical protein
MPGRAWQDRTHRLQHLTNDQRQSAWSTCDLSALTRTKLLLKGHAAVALRVLGAKSLGRRARRTHRWQRNGHGLEASPVATQAVAGLCVLHPFDLTADHQPPRNQELD